jgi:hypothetical protein
MRLSGEGQGGSISATTWPLRVSDVSDSGSRQNCEMCKARLEKRNAKPVTVTVTPVSAFAHSLNVRRRKSHEAIELEPATNSSGKAGGRTCAGISVRRQGSDARWRRIGDRKRSDEEEPRSSAPQEMKMVAPTKGECRNPKRKDKTAGACDDSSICHGHAQLEPRPRISQMQQHRYADPKKASSV